MSEVFCIDPSTGKYIGQDGKARKMRTPNYGLIGHITESRDVDVRSDVSICEEVDIQTDVTSLNEQKEPNELQLV